jgi:hypothetical protein
MPDPSFMPDDAASEFLPLRFREGRVLDAETIRQDFVKSQGSMPDAAAPPKPLTKPHEDEC